MVYLRVYSVKNGSYSVRFGVNKGFYKYFFKAKYTLIYTPVGIIPYVVVETRILEYKYLGDY